MAIGMGLKRVAVEMGLPLDSVGSWTGSAWQWEWDCHQITHRMGLQSMKVGKGLPLGGGGNGTGAGWQWEWDWRCMAWEAVG